MGIKELMKLRWELATQDDLIIIRNFIRLTKHNHEYENKIEVDFRKAKKAVVNLEKLIKQSAEVVNATIPPLKILEKILSIQ